MQPSTARNPATLPDRLLEAADRALRALFAPPTAGRPTPGPAAAPLAEAERQTAAQLMRVNHAGEIAAQGLYHGQALAARDPALRQQLLNAAQEEADHLAWCRTRLTELADRPSHLDPFWYAGSLALGVVAGLAGDRTSLGFIAETEQQVERHLDDHLQRLPITDERSRAILSQMRADEIVHGQQALAAGGAALPKPVRALMQATSRIMTTTASHF